MPAIRRVLIVGNPNVGKSALFNRLTGRYATVSNYPGTTVEVARGRARLPGGVTAEVIDTPGLYSLLPITEEERVAADMLREQPAHVVLHVVDTKNLPRMLGLTLQLIEAQLPVVLVLNLYDEARELGIRVDVARLSERLGIPVVITVSTTGEGFPALLRTLASPVPISSLTVEYGTIIETAIRRIAERLGNGHHPLSARTRAALLLQGDEPERIRLARQRGEGDAADILHIVAETRARLNHSPHYYATLALRARVEEILGECFFTAPRAAQRWRRLADRLCMSPLTGFPIMAAILYFGLYGFVGRIGAGVVVDWLEDRVFEAHFIPWADYAVRRFTPALLHDLFVGEYGMLTLGLRYAVAIILPVVGAFFLMFAILEDSGYLPRLAMLADRAFKPLGLNGRAVIPMALGFGCDTMATLVTRTLETRRERILCTLLLALAIPCSAQLGVILALLSSHPGGLLLWVGVVASVFFAVGRLGAVLLPGDDPMFYMELPPLRWPLPGNVLVKTYTRMVWYFREILPMFLLASVLIWAGQITHVFALTLRAMTPALRLLGLPPESGVAFLFGFFRRDYGAAGLYDLQEKGLLTGNQLTVAAITLTLFLPCVAQLLVMHKERGWRMTAAISGVVLTTAFTVGWTVHQVLQWTGIFL